MTEDDEARVLLGRAMERLLESSEWPQLVRWMEERVGQSFYAEVMKPLTGMDGALSAEYAKGTLKGIELTLTQPKRIIDEMRAILETAAKEDEYDGPDDGDGSGGSASEHRVGGHRFSP